MDWLDELPAAYLSLGPGGTDPEPPTSPGDQDWEAPERFDDDDYYHPDAEFEMRSIETDGGHGHQACYDIDGDFIPSGVSAGTADLVHNSHKVLDPTHKDEDVFPFIRAAQLDGNPVDAYDFVPLHLNRPMMYEGDNIEEYLRLRPPIPNGKPLLAPRP